MNDIYTISRTIKKELKCKFPYYGFQTRTYKAAFDGTILIKYCGTIEERKIIDLTKKYLCNKLNKILVLKFSYNYFLKNAKKNSN